MNWLQKSFFVVKMNGYTCVNQFYCATLFGICLVIFMCYKFIMLTFICSEVRKSKPNSRNVIVPEEIATHQNWSNFQVIVSIGICARSVLIKVYCLACCKDSFWTDQIALRSFQKIQFSMWTNVDLKLNLLQSLFLSWSYA